MTQEINYSNLLFALGNTDQFGQIDEQSRKAAESLNEDQFIYHSYAILDSLSSSYSMFKYFFDIFNPNSDSNDMHDAMLTTNGITAIIIESFFLASFSLIASLYEKKKLPKKIEQESIEEDPAKQEKIKQPTDPDWFWIQISEAWPYLRTVMKGLKNAYKGWRSAIIAAGILSGLELKYLITPVGIILGVFAAINRCWLQSMIDSRKNKMKLNEKKQEELINMLKMEPSKKTFFSEKDVNRNIKEICYQSEEERILAYLAVIAGSLIDSLYLYVGVLGLASLSFSMLSYLASVCAVYTVACVVSRVYEEYDYQNRLYITQTECKLAITARRLETSYKKLLKLFTHASDEKIHLMKEINLLIGLFAAERKLLEKQHSRSYFSVALIGIKSGLYAYGALASALFLAASLFTLAGINFPPFLLVFTVSLGLAFMSGFMVHTLILHNKFLKKEKVINKPFEQLLAMKCKIKDNKLDEDLIDMLTMSQLLTTCTIIKPPPKFLFQETFEVIRSTFSGIGKGQKFIDFSGNALQEKDEQGHYHSSKLMAVFSLVSSLVFGMVLGVRALARGFGRKPLGQKKVAPIDVEISSNGPQSLTSKGAFDASLYKSPNNISKRKEKPDTHTKMFRPMPKNSGTPRNLNRGSPSDLGIFAKKGNESSGGITRSSTLDSRTLSFGHTIEGLS